MSTNHLDTTSNDSAAKIDHGAMVDNTPSADTIAQGAETIPTNRSDLSFWGGNWYWDKYASQYTDDPRDQWVIKPSPQLVGNTIQLCGVVQKSCITVLGTKKQEEVDKQIIRHREFFGPDELPDDEAVSEFLDLMNSYQSRFIEAVQQYDSKCKTYERVSNDSRSSEEQVEDASIIKSKVATKCRYYVAKLEALVTVYNDTVSDESPFQLKYSFNPATEQDRNMLRINVEQTLNKIGRRMSRSVKQGKMDARTYNIPIPWQDDQRQTARVATEELLDDFDS